MPVIGVFKAIAFPVHIQAFCPVQDRFPADAAETVPASEEISDHRGFKIIALISGSVRQQFQNRGIMLSIRQRKISVDGCVQIRFSVSSAFSFLSLMIPWGGHFRVYALFLIILTIETGVPRFHCFLHPSNSKPYL